MPIGAVLAGLLGAGGQPLGGAPVALLGLLISDGFSGTNNTPVDGRTPDTLSNGEVWHYTGWAYPPIINLGYFQGVLNQSWGMCRINCKTIDHRIAGESYSNMGGAAATSDLYIGIRCTDIADDGFPTDCIYAQLSSTYTNYLYERIAGVSTLLGTSAGRGSGSYPFTLGVVDKAVKLTHAQYTITANATVNNGGTNCFLAARQAGAYMKINYMTITGIDTL